MLITSFFGGSRKKLYMKIFFKMSKLILLASIAIFSQLALGKSEDGQQDEDYFNSFSTAVEKFWSVSCEFSDIWESDDPMNTSRSKRSLHYQEPNFEDPMELFNYLYPLADVTPEEYFTSNNEQQQRSGQSSFLLSNAMWIQDLVDLWVSECHSRMHPREKRDALRHSLRSDGADTDPPNYYKNSEDEILEDEDNHNPYSGYYDDDAKNSTITPTTPAPAAATKKKEKKKISDADTFFAQYGGDIEYFFPLISFGIPFDGEITFLGFHGFKGLFPYK